MSARAERWISLLILLGLAVGYGYVLRDVFVTHRFMLTYHSVENSRRTSLPSPGCPTTCCCCAAPRRDQEESPWLPNPEPGHLFPLQRS